jgi:hypothetical protein
MKMPVVNDDLAKAAGALHVVERDLVGSRLPRGLTRELRGRCVLFRSKAVSARRHGGVSEMRRLEAEGKALLQEVKAAAFREGARVMCNGYQGTIVKVCDGQLAGMYEVRLPGGVVCVGGSELRAA